MSRIADHQDTRGQICDRHVVRSCQLVCFVDDQQIERAATEASEIRRRQMGVRHDHAWAHVNDGRPAPGSRDPARQGRWKIPMCCVSQLQSRKAILKQTFRDIVELTHAGCHHQHAQVRCLGCEGACAFDEKCFAGARW
ncbi:hypothetical protein AOQ72_04930 [Bradyrhizobium yuanmingense]|uniref:Uncharacterized protein n=1 Tax=Bradyrhizobium yuanmingense TaxID=108015 RepID=A0A0R3BQT5_9BRAD|nr:hypothetical protein AOQ72_04930 [Bradyrhizobium yuanmingense]